MPQFDCEGLDKNGREFSQRIDAPDEYGAREQLRSMGIFCTRMKLVDVVVHRTSSTFSAADSSDLDDQLLELLRQNKIIQAVKVYRDAKKCDLRSAKTYVDSLAQRNGIVPRGCAARASVLLLVVAVALVTAAITICGN